MPRPRLDTVSSIVRHGDFVSMSVDTLDPKSRIRFRCSCGSRGRVLDRSEVQFALAAICLDWAAHLELEHSEVLEGDEGTVISIDFSDDGNRG